MLWILPVILAVIALVVVVRTILIRTPVPAAPKTEFS